jgi:hypothetical protein
MYDSLLDAVKRGSKNRKRRRKLRSSEVVVVSQAKSGRTWLAAMISHIYHQRLGIPCSEIIRFDNFRRLDPRAPRILFTHDNRRDALQRPLFRPHDFDGVKVVLLVRDPRDVSVSSYFQILRNARRPGPARPVTDDRGSMFEYVAKRKLPQAIAFLKRWQEQLPSIGSASIVRYEDLRRHPEAELARIMRLIDGRVDPVEIERAVTFGEFDNLRHKELVGFFSSDRLSSAPTADPDSLKVRRGKVGGYVDYFTPEEIFEIDLIVSASDLKAFGYGSGPGLDKLQPARLTNPASA